LKHYAHKARGLRPYFFNNFGRVVRGVITKVPFSLFWVCNALILAAVWLAKEKGQSPMKGAGPAPVSGNG
jgi:hypothetical protein